MTKQVYQTAQGQSVDLGAIVLKNEHVRAVGNMNVNARGDKIDADNRVVDQRNQQVQRQAERTTVMGSNVDTSPVHTSTSHAKRNRAQMQAQAIQAQQEAQVDPVVEESAPVEADTVEADQVVTEPAPLEVAPEPVVVATPPAPPKTVTVDDTSGQGGLASAIARSKVIEQEKLKTAKQIAQAKPGVTRI